MQKLNSNNELCIAVCPDCGFCSVCDPVWLQIVGQTLSCECDNCMDEIKKPHLIKKFKELESNKDEN